VPPARHTGMSHPRYLVAVVLAALALTGCAAAGTPGSSVPSPGDTRADRLPAPITIDRSGGFAGVRQRITVQPAGEWTVTGPAGTTRTGVLSADQRATLRRLVTGGTWWTDRRPSTSPAPCADGFAYVVVIGDHTAAADDCTMGGLPALRGLVTLIVGATSR
jgi:hypothetical protein